MVVLRVGLEVLGEVGMRSVRIGDLDFGRTGRTARPAIVVDAVLLAVSAVTDIVHTPMTLELKPADHSKLTFAKLH
jgi:hypothetical protein